jgi:hypothetical protein
VDPTLYLADDGFAIDGVTVAVEVLHDEPFIWPAKNPTPLEPSNDGWSGAIEGPLSLGGRQLPSGPVRCKVSLDLRKATLTVVFAPETAVAPHPLVARFSGVIEGWIHKARTRSDTTGEQSASPSVCADQPAASEFGQRAKVGWLVRAGGPYVGAELRHPVESVRRFTLLTSDVKASILYVSGLSWMA